MEVNHFDQFIAQFENLISPDLCKKMIQEFQQSDSKEDGQVLKLDGSREENSVKKSTDLAIPNTGAWQDPLKKIVKGLEEAIQIYISEVPALQMAPVISTPFKIQHYQKEKGGFNWHVDAIGTNEMDRQVAFILYLNDVKQGGETEFFHQKVHIQPKAGRAILFPTFWTHMHKGKVPLSEDKYIVTSFIKFHFQG